MSLSQGSTGPDVVTVQQALIDKGILSPKNPSGTPAADGKFGPGTLAAVKAFQTSVGLPSTGVVDVATLSALGVNTGAIASIASPSVQQVNMPADAQPKGWSWGLITLGLAFLGAAGIAANSALKKDERK
jgi:putative chitinase